jgi:prepilin-type N-terminal cleavage/methylation domain-containing protein
MSATRMGSGRRCAGFTVIELLIVLVLVSILVTIGMMKLNDSKRNSYISTMKADLRNLATMAESKYASDNGYSGLVANSVSRGVHVEVSASASEWSATATHDMVPGMICAIGSATPGPDRRPMPDCQ